MRGLPPLASLRALEATTRLHGFTRAAEELGVTQSAVSQHIRALEEALGVRLVVRGRRDARGTEAGQRLSEAVRAGLGRISNTCGTISRESRLGIGSLTVSTLPGFAVKWLFPRLIAFDQRHPEIEISVLADAHPVDFTAGTADVAIRYGRGRYPGLHVEHVLPDRLFPVAAPSLLAGTRPLERPVDLAAHTLLHDDVPMVDGVQPGWTTWLTVVGLASDIGLRSRRFGQSNMVLQAAIGGLGVALGRDVLAIDDLVSGLLVRPFDEVVPSGFDYYFVCPRELRTDRRVAAFRDWLFEEAAVMPALPDAVFGD